MKTTHRATPPDLKALVPTAVPRAGAVESVATADEELLEAFIESLPGLFYLFDPDGRILRWNRQAEKISGWSGEEMSAMHPLQLIAEEDRELVACRIADVLAQGEADTEARFLTRSGEKIAFHFTGRLVQVEEKPCVLGIAIDITQRRRAAEFDAAISKLGQKLSETTTPAEAGRLIADITRDLIGWDAFTLTLYDPRSDLLTPVLAIDTIEGVPTEFPLTYPSGTRPSLPFNEVTAKGSQLILREEGSTEGAGRRFGDTARLSRSLMSVPVVKGGGGVGVLSVQSYRPQAYSQADLKTVEALASHCAGALERLRIEAALRTAEQRFVQAFESSPVAMFIGTFEEGRALLVNSAFEQVMGYSRDEILGRNGLELRFWEDLSDRAAIYEAIRQGRRVRDMQVRLRTKPGELRQVLVSVEVIEVEGERCLLFYNYDITERVNLETQLRQSQKLESIGLVAAGVAHDFNNMLTVIDGCTSLALAGGRLRGETRDLVEKISSAATRASNLTRQLLAFSSRQKLTLRELSMNMLVADLTKMLRQLAGNDVNLEIRCAPKLPFISGDPGMMEQVLMNMTVNARDAMPGGGRLLIETFQASPEARPPIPPAEPVADGYVCLRVSDTGCGISPGNLPRLFEPFFTTKEFGKGSGLGLATAYGIVKQHRGWIDVSSRIGEGTIFSVYLPASGTCRMEAAKIPSPPQVPRGAKERVLVVEDEPGVRDLICHVLRFYGYKTLQAESGPAALEVWREHADEIDAMITDVVMPGGMDGRELARRILEERPSLPVLYTSGYSPAIAGRDFLLEDGVNFLQKPFEAAMLAHTLRACLDHEAV